MRLALGALALAAGVLGAAAPRAAHAQWSTTYEQFYLQAPHNWVFRNQYRGADRLFNAFDYGHAILYETLWTKPDAPASVLERKEYDHLVKQVLVSPPHVPLEEAAIEVEYAKLAPEAKAMFDWAHILHRQLYDVLADERLSQGAKDREVARLVAYYKTRPDLAFSSKPKSMKLMQEQPYSLAFRRTYPKFNGLIWAYHWMQVGLYEPLVVNGTPETRQAGVRATVARFWQMLEDPPRTLPYQMPMTPVVAPRFTARYPEAAIIFDNLHSMHDVVSDVLANDSVPRNRKRAEILLAARRFRDDTSYVMPVEAWRTMAHHMGIENMGGPAVGFLAPLPTPTVTYGAVMQHDDRTGEMTGFRYGSAIDGAHEGHGAPARDSTAADHRMPGMEHGAHGMMHADSTHADSTHADSTHADSTHADSTHADSAGSGGTHGEHAMPGAPAATPSTQPAAKPAFRAPTRRRPAAKRATRPAPRPAPEPADAHQAHQGMTMPGMTMPASPADTSPQTRHDP
jgi:hypothetical protein